jgi:hypothetical protein
VIRHPRWFFWPQVVLFFLSIAVTVKFLQFDTNRDNLVGPTRNTTTIFSNSKRNFRSRDDLVVVVESENVEKNRQFVERLGARLEAETNLFTRRFLPGRPGDDGQQGVAVRAGKRPRRRCATRCRTTCRSSSSSRGRRTWFRFLSRSTRQFRTAKQEENAQNDSLDKIAAGAGAHPPRRPRDSLRTPRHAAVAGRDGTVRRRRRGDGREPTSHSTRERFFSSPRTRRATT